MDVVKTAKLVKFTTGVVISQFEMVTTILVMITNYFTH